MVMADSVSLTWSEDNIVAENDAIDCGPFIFELSMQDSSPIDSDVFILDDISNPLQITTET